MGNSIVKKHVTVVTKSEPITVVTVTPAKVSYTFVPNNVRSIGISHGLPVSEGSVFAAFSVASDSSGRSITSAISTQYFTTNLGRTQTEWLSVRINTPSSWIKEVVTPSKTTYSTHTPPDTYTEDPSPGWTAGGTSGPVFSDDGEATFSISGSAVQLVVGLNEAASASSVTYGDISFGIYASRSAFRIMESGVFVTPAAPFTTDLIFKITRIGGVVQYRRVEDDASGNLVLIHTSSTESTEDMVLDSSLYYGGDTIYDSALVDLGIVTQRTAGSSVSSSVLSHGILQVDGSPLAPWSTATATSSLSEVRSSILSAEVFLASSTLSGTYTVLQGGIASMLPAEGFAASYATGQGRGTMLPATSQAYDLLLKVEIGDGRAFMHPVLSSATGLTGGNNIDTTVSIEPLRGLAADRPIGQASASMQALTSEIFTNSGSPARPEVIIRTDIGQGSGTLLHTGRHILTAAHVLEGTEEYLHDYSFEFYGAPELGLIPPNAISVTYHPAWDGLFNHGNDLAIIELAEYIPWTIGIEPSQSIDNIGRDWSALSYSPRIDPVTGVVSAAGWDFYNNTYDDNEVFINAQVNTLFLNVPGYDPFNVPAESMLAYDYDNGTIENDAFGVVAGIPGLGIEGEGTAQPGDSGSARIIDGKIAGVASYAASTRSSADINTGKLFSYGDFGLDVRVSDYLDWIEETVGSLVYGQVVENLIPATAQVLITGFDTTLLGVGVEGGNTAFISGFSTSITSYTGTVVAVGSMTTAITSAVTMPVYGTASIGSFDSSIVATGQAGSLVSAVVYMRLGKSITAYTGSTCGIGAFNSIITASGLSGMIGRVTLGGISTSLTSVVTAEEFARVTVRMPLIGMLSGRANLGGFSTKIIAGNVLAVNNVIAYAVNITSNETTIYTPYNFDSILRMFNKYYGVNSTGLYLLEGADDNGVNIDVKIKTSTMDFETSLHKRVPYMYMDSDNDTLITPFVDDVAGGQHASAFAGRRTKLERGSSGRFWGFEVVNVDGNEFKLGSLEAYAQTLNRKV